jgi:small subunit ribosomal protein S3
LSVVKHFIEDSIKKTEIDEFLRNEFERAGYGGVSITKTPLGTHLVVYTMRPGLVIGRGGETIRALATILEEKFQLPSPQISVAEIEVPELNAYVVASRISSALKRGIHYRRAGFWGLTQAMEAGALGIEIIISGKLRTDRARYEKFSEGYLPKSGEPPRRYLRKAEMHVQLKPGTLGIRVSLLPPDAVFPDQIKVQVVEVEVERTPEREIVEETAVTEEKIVEPEISSVEETVVVEEPTPESVVPPVAAEKTASVEKVVKTADPSAEVKVVTEEKSVAPIEKAVTETKVETVDVPVAEPKVVTETKEVKTEAKPVAEKIVEEKVVPKEKASEPAVAPVKAPAAEKNVAETKASTTEEKKEAGE